MIRHNARIAVLMACHNRFRETLRALSELEQATNRLDYDVYLVDDGSTDGTPETVRIKFPYVNVIHGDGELYWARGMHLAWETAARKMDYDFYLWLNDDVSLKPGAIVNILSDYSRINTNSESSTINNPLVIVGACSEDTNESICSYGATDAFDSRIIPNGQPQCASGWFNGNCVLVPKEVYRRVGMISDEYAHARADYDYAERLKTADIPFYCSSQYVGVCHDDFEMRMFGKSLWYRIRLLWGPSYFNLHDLWLIKRRYHGWLKAIVSCTHLILLVLFRGVCNRPPLW